MTHPHVAVDPWEDAEKAKPPVYNHFGRITIVAENVVWPKGVALRDCGPWDAGQHKPDQRVVRITMMASPLPGRTNRYPHERIVPVYSAEWTRVALPSIKAAGVEAKELDGKWAQYIFHPARTYTSGGQEKQATMFKILNVYTTEDECIIAADEFFNKTTVAVEDEPIPGFEDEPTSGNGGKSGNGNPNYTAAVLFLPALWAQSGQDKDKMAELIADNTLTAELFDITSPEVVRVMGDAVL